MDSYLLGFICYWAQK